MNNFFCPITYSKEFDKIYSIKKFPIFMGVSKNNKNYFFEDLNWYINKKSGNVQIYPKVSLDKLYFRSHGSGTIGKTWKDHHDMFFKLVKKYLKGNICEIGGGENSIVKKIKSFSKINKIYCFDRNIKFNKKIKKIKKIKNFFDNSFFQKKNISIDLLVHSHTFEHMYDPNKFLSDVKLILSKNGKHIFTMPNMKPMIKRHYANAMNFEHPFYYDEKLIDSLLIKNNFKIIKKKLFKKDHSIMYLTKLDHSVKNINNESTIKHYSEYKENLKIFNKMFNFWKRDIVKINKLKKKYQNVFIFGAHIFSQMMLFNGLDKGNIVGILDNDKLKINKFLYGTKLKIFNPIKLKEINQPCVILRAGSYNKEIQSQLLQINKKIIII